MNRPNLYRPMHCMLTTTVFTAKQPVYCAASPQHILSELFQVRFYDELYSLLAMDYSHRKMDDEATFIHSLH